MPPSKEDYALHVKAHSEMRRMIPWLQRFARAYTGDPSIRIDMGTHPYTDGKTIYLPVSPLLATMPPHDRVWCGRRSDDRQLICNGCMAIEEITASLVHEIGHIAFGSFSTASTKANKLRAADRKLLEKHTPSFGDRDSVKLVNEIVENIELEMRSSRWVAMVQVCRVVHPAMHGVYLAIEDIRVDEAVLGIGGGVADMLYASYATLLAYGPVGSNGKRQPWYNRELPSQVITGAIFQARGLNVSEFFGDEAMSYLRDQSLGDLIAEAKTAGGPIETFAISIKFLKRMIELNLFEPRRDEDDNGDSSDGPDSGGSAGDGAGDPSTEASDQAPGGEGAGGDEGEGSDGTESGSGPGAPGSNEGESESEDGDGSPGEQGAGGDPSLGGTDDSDSEGGDGPSTADDGHAEDEGRGLADQQHDSGADPRGEQEPDGVREDGGSPDPEGAGGDDGKRDQPKADDLADDRGESGGRPTRARASSVEEIIKDLNDAVEGAIGHGDKVDAPEMNPSWQYKMDTVISHVRWFGDVEIKTLAPHVYTVNEWGSLNSAEFDTQLDMLAVTQAANRCRNVLADNDTEVRRRNQRRGKLDGSRLARRVPFNDDRLFRRKTTPDKKSWSFIWGADRSGSTRGARNRVIREMLLAGCHLSNKLDLDYAAWAHTTDRGNGSWGSHPQFTELKGFDAPWSADTLKRINSCDDGIGNLDGTSMKFYRTRLLERPTTDKVLVYITDGAMPAENERVEGPLLVEEIEKCKRLGIYIFGIGVDTDSPKKFGLDTVSVSGPSDIPLVVAHLANILRAR